MPPRMFLLSTEDCECVHLWFGWLFIGYANLLYPAGVMGWLSNVFCPPPRLGVSLQSLKCGCVQQVWVSRRGGMLLSLDASSRPGSAGRRDGEVVELLHHPPPQKRIQECASMLSPTRARGVPFGWLFIGYANLLYPAGVMGWLSNVFCPPLGLGVSLLAGCLLVMLTCCTLQV